MEKAGLAQATPACARREKNARLRKVISVIPWRYELEEKQKKIFFKAKPVSIFLDPDKLPLEFSH